MQENHKKEMMETLEKYLFLCQERSVVIFGHCNAAQEMLDYLRQEEIYPVCYLDNNMEKQGKIQEGISVFSPEKIRDFSGENSLVLIITKFYAAMAHQLRSLGYQGEIVEVVAFQSFQNFSIEETVFAQKKARVQEGYEILQEIQEKSPERFLMICPFAALGDVYWAMAYLPAFCEQQGIESVTVAVVGKACQEVASSFGWRDIFILAQQKMDSLVQAVVFTQENQAMIAHHDRVYTDPSLQMLQRKFISFSDFYKEVIYALPQETQAVVPTVTEPLSEESQTKMVQGKTVIFAPYAHSIVEVPLSFWEKLAMEYEEKGFLVLTNVAKGQAPLVGTKGISLPLKEMKAAVEYGGHFVSMRSGLCDLLQGAKAKKTLVFPRCYFSGTAYLVSEFFSLEGWETIVVS